MNILGVLFVPFSFLIGISVTWVFLNVLKLPSYLPNIFCFMFFMCILEFVLPFNKPHISKKHIISDIGFLLVNPIILPLMWYLAYDSSFKRLDPIGGLNSLPLLIQIIIVFLLAEFFRYWIHRWQHEVPALWKFHAVHHCMKDFYFLNQFISHPVDYFLRNIVTFSTVMLFDFSLEAMAYAQALSTIGAMLGHGNLKIKNGFWNYLVPTYEVHRWHHSLEPKEANNNYGVATLIWDHLFRTYYWPKYLEHKTIGIKDQDYQIQQFKELLLVPFRKF